MVMKALRHLFKDDLEAGAADEARPAPERGNPDTGSQPLSLAANAPAALEDMDAIVAEMGDLSLSARELFWFLSSMHENERFALLGNEKALRDASASSRMRWRLWTRSADLYPARHRLSRSARHASESPAPLARPFGVEKPLLWLIKRLRSEGQLAFSRDQARRSS